MWFLKKRKNGIGAQVVDLAKPDRIDEVSASEVYQTYDTPGEMSGGSFVENTKQSVLIVKIIVSGTVTSFYSAFDKWSNRTTATYVPLSRRDSILN